ncbi:MAG TPA: NAD(P)-dependent oxidoreductase [Burkholderiales bacterium]|jgi:3-hydroxyisobutyrate dehydrogenase-like beta-hydroxyacid dehydrogenase|nr:NAD(P)-dependent oxidoreductase [Burkholderiales bacterium]
MIGFIGLGVMGEPICRHLATKSGQALLGFDVRREPLERLVAAGVVAAATVRDVAERCEIVFLSLPGGDEVKEVCTGRSSLLLFLRAGSAVVDLSTTPVALTRELHTRFAARGIRFVDAPVARTRAAAQEGTLSVMVGAAEADFVRLQPLLAHFASDITRCGDPGAGQAIKIVNNLLLFQNVAALAEALALVRRLDLDAELALRVLAKGSADSFALRNHAMKAMLPDQYPRRAFSVAYALKDIGYALELAQQAGVELTGGANARALLERAAAAGHAEEYFPVIAKVL